MVFWWKTVVHRKISGKNQGNQAGTMEKKESYQQIINKLWITFEMCIRWEKCLIKKTEVWKK